MALFNWFGKKESSPPAKAKSIVWMHAAAKQKGVLQLMQQNPHAALIAWFPHTQEQWQNYFRQQGMQDQVMIARQQNALQLVNKPVILLEHYPLAGKELAFLRNLNSSAIFIVSSLDEPLFNYFGGDGIIKMLQGMGMQEEEPIEHELVTRAVLNAQQKLEKKIVAEHAAQSMEEWFERNSRK